MSCLSIFLSFSCCIILSIYRSIYLNIFFSLSLHLCPIFSHPHSLPVFPLFMVFSPSLFLSLSVFLTLFVSLCPAVSCCHYFLLSVPFYFSLFYFFASPDLPFLVSQSISLSFSPIHLQSLSISASFRSQRLGCCCLVLCLSILTEEKWEREMKTERRGSLSNHPPHPVLSY